MSLIEVKVPDIGDFEDVEIIEVICNVDDKVALEDPLISVESDKATMDVPSPVAGIIREIKVKAGDKVSEGSLILKLETKKSAKVKTQKSEKIPPSQNSKPDSQSKTLKTAKSFSGKADMTCDVLVLGSGPGGYTAAFRAADLGQEVILVERYNRIGGVCLNVG